MPPGNDFGSQTISRPLTAEFQNHSQVSDLQQQAYPPMHGEDMRFRPPPSYNSPSQQFVGPSLLREDHLAQRSMLGLNAPSSFAQGDNQPLPTPFLRELSANKMQQFSGDSLPLGELSKSSSQIHPYPQQQQPPYGLHHPETISSSSRYPPDLQETNQASHLPDFRGSRNLTHYNPYASTFEQPLGPNSDLMVLGKRRTPLTVWFNKPLDVEENNKKKEVGGVVLETSVDNEECGETADAEVGAVENESPSNPIDDSTSLPPEFVKEVLKPSWRQGNMSKEAFKTIVKKTVDKVSGAMKSHQIPKSRAKIDQYIDSSQRKLTKLVTGYVDKYVKM
ncbi:hypothetical protein LWI29_012435 [Acer saccharum]|uniref:SFR19-like C-terminal domain-containing protein n=1 Tax=Acer saccharum TaxID=4024 RepID=A0AA39S6Z3_ACESA|nr:hypothetical protein LWI29_012435 [Acer saccharum]